MIYYVNTSTKNIHFGVMYILFQVLGMHHLQQLRSISEIKDKQFIYETKNFIVFLLMTSIKFYRSEYIRDRANSKFVNDDNIVDAT